MVSFRSARCTLAAAALAMVLTACAAQAVPGAASPAADPAAAGQSDLASAENTARGATGPGVDACALVPAADVEALIGKNDGGNAAAPVGDGGNCVWTNTDNEYSVSVDIGATDTAANGLPELDPAVGDAEPLADGMRFFAGAVEFAAKGRDCTVQVATNETTDGGDKAAAVKLATAVQGKV